jgi:spore germination protein GerM
VAKVDLSREFASGGGTFSVTARLAQVVYTLTQFPTVDAVEFYIEGVRSEVFSSEGIVLDRPQRFEDYDDLLPIDA